VAQVIHDNYYFEDNVNVGIDAVVINKLSAGGSAGDLPKWMLRDSSGFIWAKGRSKDDSFEPEAEVCAYRLACLFGVPAIPYSMISKAEFSDKPVCVSRDYSQGLITMSLIKYLLSLGMEEISVLDGLEKLRLVESVLSEQAKMLHRSILLFDYIVGNDDRHLRNFDVRVNKDSSLHSLVELYDTGAALFSSQSLMLLKQACNQRDNYVKAKPYANPQLSQLELLRSVGCYGLLRAASKVEIYKAINSCFSGERAKLLGTYVIKNAERLGLICK